MLSTRPFHGRRDMPPRPATKVRAALKNPDGPFHPVGLHVSSRAHCARTQIIISQRRYVLLAAWPASGADTCNVVRIFAATREIGLVGIERRPERNVGGQLAGAKVRYRLRYRRIGGPYRWI
jgi:hypothetical protein